MITTFVYACEYPDLFGHDDFVSSVLVRECSAQMCVNWLHPENECPKIGIHTNPPLKGTCNSPDCDCVEWFHQVVLVLAGQEPAWRSDLLPKTKEALRASLSKEFLSIIDDPKYKQLNAPIRWNPLYPHSAVSKPSGGMCFIINLAILVPML